ncbi:MAG: GntR family transcriptional regulator [Gottschalkiaceae bacterium]|nr:MAG: GntR family transcriptional regulator [Gottschalkiaceae bacterium]
MDNLLWNKTLDENKISQCPTLGDEIFHLLRHRILSGYYKRGERLSEVQLSAELKTSRSPIREAFIQLENTGLVKTVKRKGVYVFDFSRNDVREIAELRLLLEQYIVKVLIEEDKVTDSAIHDLQNIIDDMQDIYANKSLSEDENTYQSSQLDFKFHLTMAQLANRPAFFELISNIITRSRAIIGLLDIHPNTKMVIADHRLILETFQEGDVEKAQNIVKQHLRWMWECDYSFSETVDKSKPLDE